jgi:hypothetical protein
MERLLYEMTHEAQSSVFADSSSAFLLTQLDGDIAEWKGPCACCFV